jgi:hypothetical protein
MASTEAALDAFDAHALHRTCRKIDRGCALGLRVYLPQMASTGAGARARFRGNATTAPALDGVDRANGRLP